MEETHDERRCPQTAEHQFPLKLKNLVPEVAAVVDHLAPAASRRLMSPPPGLLRARWLIALPADNPSSPASHAAN